MPHNFVKICFNQIHLFKKIFVTDIIMVGFSES